eukprot:TRINITY_DN4017_c0_g3_i1.p2 TRINITY_DN4017_c0_g3~~TRINITY_DN4017_c0_g3_i1.p2  ORF type:complete len:206 (+),score=40.13 TRINITY_DN4017_c0_g3_i1:995-1612(+)
MDPRSQQVPSFTLLSRHRRLSTSIKDFQCFECDPDDANDVSEERIGLEEVCVEKKVEAHEPACTKTAKTDVQDEAPVSIESLQIATTPAVQSATAPAVPDGKELKDQNFLDVLSDAKEPLVSKAISADGLLALSSATQDNLSRLMERMNELQERQASILERILERALSHPHLASTANATANATSVACGRPLEPEKHFCGYQVAET